MFVDRELEIRELEEAFSMFLEGHSRGVIVYGFRKVGKTTLVKRFVEEKNGFWIDLSWVSSVEGLINLVARMLGDASILKSDDPVDSIANTLQLFERYGRKHGFKFPVALDEFHILVERLPLKLAKKYGLKRDDIFVELLWKLRAVISASKHVFWILISSIGWYKIQEYLRERERAKGALLGLLDRLEVKPLDINASRELALKLIRERDFEVADKLAKLSGGIPRIIEILSRRYNTTNEKPLKLTTRAIEEGEFDELFDSMIRFLAEFSKRNFDTFVQALKSISEDKKTPDEVAKYMGTTRDSAYNILEELVKLGLLEREKKKGKVYYSMKYPLLREWLQLRVQPTKNITDLLARALGITAESYMRELLELARNKKIELYEDKKGETFYGTTNKLELNISKILTREEAKKILHGLKNADIIAENKEVYVFEVKTTIREINESEIDNLARIGEKIKNRVKKQVNTILAILEGKPTQLAIAKAIKQGVIIMSPKAIRILSKKLNIPHW